MSSELATTQNAVVLTSIDQAEPSEQQYSSAVFLTSTAQSRLLDRQSSSSAIQETTSITRDSELLLKFITFSGKACVWRLRSFHTVRSNLRRKFSPAKSHLSIRDLLSKFADKNTNL